MKNIYDYKLGEVIDKKHLGEMSDIFDGDVKLVKITFTFQDTDGATMASSLIHKDYIEDTEEELKK